MPKTTIRPEQAGVPAGGSTAEVLTKSSNTDFDYNWVPAAGGGSFQGSQAVETPLSAGGDFSPPAYFYDEQGDSFYYAPGGAGIRQAFVKTAEGIYQPCNLTISGITVAGTVNFFHNGNFYVGKATGPNLVFDVYDISTAAFLGTTNSPGAYVFGSGQITSCHCTNDGRWVGSWCFNGVIQVIEADLTLLTFSAINAYVPTGSFGQSFTGAPVNWGTYKKSKSSTNYVFENSVYDYTTSGVPSRIAHIFPIQARVLAWGTTLSGDTIMMLVPGSQTQGNPSGFVNNQVYIRLLDTTQLLNWNATALISVTL